MIDLMSGKDTDAVSSSNPKQGSKAGMVVACLCLVALVAGGGYWVKTHNKPAAVATSEQSVAAVRVADAAWAKAATAHDLVNALSYYANDAVVLPAHEEMLTNKPDISKAWTALLDKNNTVEWKPMWVEAAKSGELVYVVGTYSLTTKAGKSKPVVDHGKYLAVWKKQEDGSWKAEANTWNSDLPETGAKRS